MPGLNILTDIENIPKTVTEKYTSDLIYRSDYQMTKYLSDKNVKIVGSHYPAYPIHKYDSPEYLILIEGIIYSHEKSDVLLSLENIAEAFQNNQDSKDKLTSFIDNSDGEYLIVIYLKKENRLIIFNDRFGRLPTFYSYQNNRFALSREMKFILNFVPSILFDKKSIAQFLTLGYPLNDRTLFANIHRLDPATLITLSRAEDKLNFEIENIIPLSFEYGKNGLSFRRAVDEYSDLFLDTLDRRLSSLDNFNLRPVVDLSGGFDTRVILAGMCRLGADMIICHDNLVTGDESDIARQVASRFGKQLKLFSARHPMDNFDIIRDITYLTDCMVSGYVSVACFYDDLEREKKLKNGYAHFMGLGGGMVRHPYKPKSGYDNLPDMILNNAFSKYFGAIETCTILNLDYQLFEQFTIDEIERFPESNLVDRTRHLYFEDSNKFVNGGENRHRIFQWTISPFCGTSLLKFQIQNIPLPYIGYDFFIEFMRTIDSRTLDIPIFGSRFKLNNPISRRLMLIKRSLTELIRDNRHSNKYARQRLNRRRAETEYDETIKSMVKKMLEICLQSDLISEIFNLPSLTQLISKPVSRQNFYQVLTLILYISSLEENQSGKNFSVQ